MTEKFLSDDDLQVWYHVSKTVDPLPGRELVVPVDTSEVVAKSEQQEVVNPFWDGGFDGGVVGDKELPYIKEGEITGVDKSTAKRIIGGKFDIEAKLDLHGKTQDQAFDVLRQFIIKSYNCGKRRVLVVTGKGAGGHGVLKMQVPRWLNVVGIREYVLLFSFAKPGDGGEGALYVLLKRKR